MLDGGRVSLAVLSFYVGIKIRVATLGVAHSVTESTQTINRCFNPEASRFCSPVQSAQLARDSRCVRRNDQVIDQFEVRRSYFTCSVHKDKQMLVFNFKFDLP
jgi:hypothetical protein